MELLFEDFDCFCGDGVFFSIGAGYGAERGLVLEGAEFGERDFAMGVGVRRVAAE
jgi:hypothetical protein